MNIKKIIVALLIIFQGITLLAQNSTSSPYSAFGIGELEMTSGGRNTAMGQTGIALRSDLFLNTSNPASLTAISPQSFIFDLGVNFEYTQLKNSTKTADATDGNLSWLQMAFPISKKLFGGISLNPKSSVGYNIFTTKSIDGTSTTYPSIYEGTGGLSEAAGMLAWKLTKNISFGAKAGYLWGNVAQTLDESIAVSSTIYTITKEDDVRYSGSYFNIGTQISIPVSTKSSFVLGGIAGISSRLNSEISTTITKTYSSTSETISSDVKTTGSMKLPLDIGVGLSYLYGNKWIATADYRRCDWRDATLDFSSNKLSINNSYRGGLEFSPKNDPSLFRQATKYRLGFRYESGYLNIYSNQIHEQAVSFGIGIPIKKDRSYANFSVELGSRGTTKNSLVQEKFVKLNCSFNLWDKWFTKRQID
ncbi:MAG TPA: hypothetical protein VFC65_08175 [Prolixibacteraceae bacterium]|nr:hypothetical protein [Prolixibacteraceae bacterium]